ncbi:UDP-N-acetylmuramoyl-tripeptide--D-alanyl-D-alanine ligase, partial [bacterium]|nr:UDP-N-acetylmuramoyl-tripeptide--D-alanyl-D-alanine ligase [bacterium]
MREDEIVKACGAKVLKSGGNAFEYCISTDTRKIKNGELYLPLKGANFDGEKFIQEALDKGAAGYFTTGDDVCASAKCVFNVKDTLEAYLQLANFYKNKIAPIVIGITGSSGKTTTKEMVYAVVNEKFRTVKTFSNHNNEIGFCQTVFEMQPDTEVLIVEMGMRGLGEISLISKYAQPNFAVITNSGSAHVGRLGSLENIAKAKCEIAEFLKSEGAFIALNQDRIKNTVKYSGEKIYYSISDVEILDKKPSFS